MHPQKYAAEQISPKIKALREKHGYTNYRLAKLSGLSETTIGEILEKGRIPNIDTLEKICYAFGISLSGFFASDGEYPNLTEDEQTIINIWENLGAEDRKLLLDIVKCFGNK